MEAAKGLWNELAMIADLQQRLEASYMLFPAEIKRACRQGPPTLRDDLPDSFFFRESAEEVECIPRLQYCSCPYFEKNVIQAKRSITCSHLLAILLNDPFIV
jgi:predicted nucleic acid-binding Zn finger protein